MEAFCRELAMEMMHFVGVGGTSGGPQMSE